MPAAVGKSLRAATVLSVAVLSFLVCLLLGSVRHLGSGHEDLDEELLSLRSALSHQLAQRRQEILPLLSPGHEKEPFSTWDSNLWGELTRGSSAAGTPLGCGALLDMQPLEVLGSGYTKLVVKVTLAGGEPVALKMVNEHGIDMGKCVEGFKDPHGCRQLVSYKLSKEVVLLHRLRHPNIIKLRGHCAGDAGTQMTAILEQGNPLQMLQLLQSPWEDRFRVCLDLARLLHFLSRSPLGSVALLDFQPRQFVMVSGELKLTDLDDASAADTPCGCDADCSLQFPHRNFTLTCSARGVCEGFNEKMNIYNAYRYFFTYLLPHQAPPGLTHLVQNIMNVTGELKADINETLDAFENILDLYKSGLHLDKLPSSILRDYNVMRGMATSGNTEYHCWPSYSQQGCVLSIHSASEAAHICNSHSQCTSFTLTGQKTWTGRPLATFRSSFKLLVPDETSEVYVKKSTAVLGSRAAASAQKARGRGKKTSSYSSTCLG
ncbi:extracellular tyrosine-protein kinase PKDCC [Syngnathus typhle]|uniref:extracellular tyrosine-protein kinase PKDCC n=1 Tax=Syngnathus typhle TaxID=161592 RepID=UPI002A6B782F|nr:extracellular tyrosine-protein kinase PKDCC [Syngnathus typhle]